MSLKIYPNRLLMKRNLKSLRNFWEKDVNKSIVKNQEADQEMIITEIRLIL